MLKIDKFYSGIYIFTWHGWCNFYLRFTQSVYVFAQSVVAFYLMTCTDGVTECPCSFHYHQNWRISCCFMLKNQHIHSVIHHHSTKRIIDMLPSSRWSPCTFRLTRSCQTFFVLQCSQQRTFQICNWVIWRGVMVGYATLEVTNIMYNHDQNSKSELEIVVSCFAWYVSFHTLLSNILPIAMFSTTYVSDL